MQNVKRAVEKYSEIIGNAEQYIWDNPEVGYKEYKTNDFMIAEFEKLGYKLNRFDNMTGFTTYYDTGKKGPTVLVMAELDSLYCSLHPESDKETGACHVCGHNTQCAALLGVSAAIREADVNGGLCGKVKFGVVPAEEGIELGYRSGLIKEGKITFTSGKPECILRGMLDDVDIAFMIHGGNSTRENVGSDAVYYFTGGHNGVIRKRTVISGKASHAGGAPWDGVNALYAAELVFSACNALRETFKDEDYIRFHSIITKGGDSVNAIPDEIVIESYVRGATVKSLKSANNRINRAIVGACLSIGANVTINDNAGSEPLSEDKNLTELMRNVGEKLAGKGKSISTGKFEPSSTDMGDVSCLVPSVHGYIDSYRGTAHGKDYQRIRPVEACVQSAELQLGTIIELLKDDAKNALDIISKFKPVYPSIAEYIKEKKSVTRTINAIEYTADGIKINL